MSFADAVRSVLKKYASFEGRARRSEFWYGGLFVMLVVMAGFAIDLALGAGGNVYLVVLLAMMLPSLAVSARRLHDVDQSAWWLLLYITPLTSLFLFYWWLKPGTPGANDYGLNPKEAYIVKIRPADYGGEPTAANDG